MGDLPKLPPGCVWERVIGDGLRPTADGEPLSSCCGTPEEMAEEARGVVAHLLRAHVQAAATEAGVVLPKGFDVGDVLRDGARALGTHWKRAPYELQLWHAGHLLAVVEPAESRFAGTDDCVNWIYADTEAECAVKVYAAMGPAGLPMPPLPGAT